jgi:hypothetical protein
LLPQLRTANKEYAQIDLSLRHEPRLHDLVRISPIPQPMGNVLLPQSPIANDSVYKMIGIDSISIDHRNCNSVGALITERKNNCRIVPKLGVQYTRVQPRPIHMEGELEVLLLKRSDSAIQAFEVFIYIHKHMYIYVYIYMFIYICLYRYMYVYV